MERVPDFNAGDELTTKVVHQMARAIQELQKLAIMQVESPLTRANNTLLCHVPPTIQVLVHNASGADRLIGEVLGIDSATIDPSTDPDGFQERPVQVEGVTPADPDHLGRFVVLLEDIDDDDTGTALVSGPVAMKVSGADPFADINPADPTGSLLGRAKGSARVLWHQAGEGNDWAIVLLGTGGSGVALCTSDAYGGIGPSGGEGGTDTTPAEGDAAGDVVSGTGHMFDEEIDWENPPDPEDMPTPEEGGTWNPQVSMNLGKWLRDNWIPANAAAIITALGATLTTAIDTEVGVYVTAHAGDVVGPAITVWLGDNIATITTSIINGILADPGELFCMDDVAPVAPDATGDGTNRKHVRINGHLHTDGLVLNPHAYLDPTAIFCSVDDAATATPITGSDTAGHLVLRGSIFWDGGASRWNIISLIDPNTFLCIQGLEGDELIPSGTLYVKGHMYPEAEGGPFNPMIPFPPGDDRWIEVDAANGIIKHIGPGASAFATTGSLALTGLDLDAKGHVRTVSYCTIAAGFTIGPCAP